MSSLLLALLFSIGLVAGVLFLLWFSNRVMTPPAVALDVEFTEVNEEGEGGGDGRPAGGSQLDTPSEEAFVSQDKETNDMQENLNLLNSAVASKAVELDDPDFVKPMRKAAFGSGGGVYGGFGDGRGLGHGPGKPGWPRHWEVMFSKATLEEYSKQLQFFNIELGVLQPGNKVLCIKNLTKPKPDTYVIENAAFNERRYYLTWRNAEMQEADHELLTRAGVDPGDRLILKFLPRETEGQLIALERAYNGLTPKDIRKTRFGVIAEGGGFKFVVIDQMVKR
jgi:hypothetical protein